MERLGALRRELAFRRSANVQFRLVADAADRIVAATASKAACGMAMRMIARAASPCPLGPQTPSRICPSVFDAGADAGVGERMRRLSGRLIGKCPFPR
jgi:hypothetical protein